METHLSIMVIIVRLLLAVVAAALIGYDREHYNHPAGIRTHILVCAGACVVALIQKEIGFNAIEVAMQHPHYADVIHADEARLICQVISGIGFLGAGTIIVQQHQIKGLTTAASLWVVACIGLAFGMGDYTIGVIATVLVIIVLIYLRNLVSLKPLKKLEVQYTHKVETKKAINIYFSQHQIKVQDVNYSMEDQNGERLYTNVYEIRLPKNLTYADVIEDLSLNQNITKLSLLSE